MKKDVTNSCGNKRGCEITLLPSDSRIRPVFSGMYETEYDIQKILSLAYIPLDEKLEKERQMEKMAA